MMSLMKRLQIASYMGRWSVKTQPQSVSSERDSVKAVLAELRKIAEEEGKTIDEILK